MTVGLLYGELKWRHNFVDFRLQYSTVDPLACQDDNLGLAEITSQAPMFEVVNCWESERAPHAPWWMGRKSLQFFQALLRKTSYRRQFSRGWRCAQKTRMVRWGSGPSFCKLWVKHMICGSWRFGVIVRILPLKISSLLFQKIKSRLCQFSWITWWRCEVQMWGSTI